MIGKVPPELLDALVVSRTGASDERVLQGPAYGEDAAAIRVGDEVLVVNSDPISLAVDRIGTLGVNVACNDVAASGAVPEWLTVAVFLPDSKGNASNGRTAEETLDEITSQLDEEATRQGVAIVGGHSEYDPSRSTPMLVLTCFGLADQYVPTSGARPGDRILMTKSAGIEATAILASDFEDLVGADVSPSDVERGRTFYDDISVVPEAAIVADRAHAMHDPTEGGLVDGLFEMAVASDVTLEIDRSSIPVRDVTRRLCGAAGVDPLRTFGSGTLIAALPGEATEEVSERLRERGIENTVVGTATETDEASLVLGDETFTEAIRDDMYALWE